MNNKGFGLIELIVAISVVFVMVVSVVGAYVFFINTAYKNTKITKATFLLEEGLEAVRSIRDTDWGTFSNISTSTNLFLTFDNGWKISNDDIYLDSLFERKIVLSDVYRDENDGVVDSGGTFDAGTRKVDVFVSWRNPNATTTVSASEYLTNLFQ